MRRKEKSKKGLIIGFIIGLLGFLLISYAPKWNELFNITYSTSLSLGFFSIIIGFLIIGVYFKAWLERSTGTRI